MFESVTDYIVCHYNGELNLEIIMEGPIACHMYECLMTVFMKMPDAKQ